MTTDRYDGFVTVPRDWHWDEESGLWQPPAGIDPAERRHMRDLQRIARQYDNQRCNWRVACERVGRLV